jgi:hypothetical protein
MPMRSTLRSRFWLEVALASLSGLLGIVTVFWRDWIEAIFGFDPDHHNGSFEWMIVVVLLSVSVLIGVAARREWRQGIAVEARS